MRVLIKGLVLVALTLGMIHTAYAVEPPIMIEGRVVNGTAEAPTPSGIIVWLAEEGPDGKKVAQAVTDETGGFVFEGVASDPITVYSLSLAYEGAVYGTLVDLNSEIYSLPEILIHESTVKGNAISMASMSILFAAVEAERKHVKILEIVRLLNDSDTTYTPSADPMELLRFGLPKDATALQVNTGLLNADFVQVDRGFALLAAVPPGEHEMMYAYEMPYENETAVLKKSFRYGAETLRVLAPKELLQVFSDQDEDVRSLTVGNTEYQVIEMMDLQPGSSRVFYIAGLPSPTLAQKLGLSVRSLRFEYTGPVVLAMLMMTLMGYGAFELFRGRAGNEDVSLTEDREAVERVMEKLDRQLREGDITPAEHDRLRTVSEHRLHRDPRHTDQ